MKKILSVLALFGLPAIAFAQPIDTLRGLLIKANDIINILTFFIVGLAVFIIIFGIIKYVAGAADEEKRKEARNYIVWGVIGVFLMLSVWGLIRILLNTLPTTNTPVSPPSTIVGIPPIPPGDPDAR